MGNWNTTVKLDPIEFDGDSISVEVSRLSVEDMAELMKFVDMNTKALKFDHPEEACKLAASIIPKYLRGIVGLTKSDGSAISIDEFAKASSEFYFVPLIGNIFAALMDASVVKGQQVKNSEAPSPNLSEV